MLFRTYQSCLSFQSRAACSINNPVNNLEGRYESMATDPVCGMQVEENKAAAKSEYQGKTYYFCSPGCKTEFEKNPQKYASKGYTEAGHH